MKDFSDNKRSQQQCCTYCSCCYTIQMWALPLHGLHLLRDLHNVTLRCMGETFDHNKIEARSA